MTVYNPSHTVLQRPAQHLQVSVSGGRLWGGSSTDIHTVIRQNSVF